ncbi:hypothetical protein HHI36_006932 [Cryptolaemus montrouzieri]|uniref:Uncharacterized protein n=1 Tax=Cryptolaemus montrouzieri TaxID=559131 RepID=A0ABD2MNH8_9CUCU
MKIYNIGELVGKAFPENIVSGFQKTGICPFNLNIFTDDDSLRSSVTDRPMNESRDGMENPSISELDGPSSRAEIVQRTNETSPSSSVLQPASASNSSKIPSYNLSLVMQEDIQPHPKIAASLKRKKIAIEEEQTARRQKINRTKTTKGKMLAKKQNISQNIPKQDSKKKRKENSESSDSEGSFRNDENESGPEKISDEEIDETRQPAAKTGF